MYTTRVAMDTHRVTHQGNKLSCAKCPFFSTDTQANLRQHNRGKHGKGWHSPCGKSYDWPAKMFCHKKKCGTCKNIKDKAKSRAERLAAKLSKK